MWATILFFRDYCTDRSNRFQQDANPVKEHIAKTELVGQRPGEAPISIIIEIGKPYLRGNDPEHWGCPVSLTPLYNKLSDQVGSNAFQALCLGIALIINLLEGFVEKGGTLRLDEGGDEFSLDTYSIGSARKI